MGRLETWDQAAVGRLCPRPLQALRGVHLASLRQDCRQQTNLGLQVGSSQRRACFVGPADVEKNIPACMSAPARFDSHALDDQHHELVVALAADVDDPEAAVGAERDRVAGFQGVDAEPYLG